MSKPICTVMVGFPAMGKSTRVHEITEVNSDAFVYSTDDYIEDAAKMNGWTYDQAFAEFIEPATKYMLEMLDVAIRSKQNVIWDQTNLGVGKRKKIINRMKQAGYVVRCECIVPPEVGHFDDLKAWKRRLQSRSGKTIPDHIITNMMGSYVEPTVDEGFQMITYYSMYGDLININYGEKQ